MKVLIMGESGSGKSTSFRTLDPKETFLIQAIPKELPFRGSAKMYQVKDKEKGIAGNKTTLFEDFDVYNLNTLPDTGAKIRSTIDNLKIKRPEIKNVVIDDVQYIMAYEFMAKAKLTGYDKFTSMAQNFFATLNAADQNAPSDFIVWILSHTEMEGDKYVMKTLGKLIKDKIVPEGIFSLVLRTEKFKGGDDELEYKFITREAGSTVKSPMGMFKDQYIDNDLQLVRNTIINYYHEEENA